MRRRKAATVLRVEMAPRDSMCLVHDCTKRAVMEAGPCDFDSDIALCREHLRQLLEGIKAVAEGMA